MILHVASQPCPRCGCLAFEDDPERGYVCLLCARPQRPFVSDAPYTGNGEPRFDLRGVKRAAPAPRPVVSIEDVRAAREAVGR